MKLFKCFMFAFIITSSIGFAEDLPKYRMVDLGLFGMDNSYAIAINERGQVLGVCEEGGCNFVFLWNEGNGLKLIDWPNGYNIRNLKFNNNGQIAGISHSNSIYKILYWDVNIGFWELESSTNPIYLIAFNDKGQVLGSVGDQIYLWDHGKKTNLTVLFQKQVPGNWNSIRAVSLNNHGHVALNVDKANATQHDPGFRSFLWKDGLFKAVILESEWNTVINVQCVVNAVNVVCIDDDDNMILTLFSDLGGGYGHLQYFISPLKNVFASCKGCELIKNGLPIARDCLPGKLKTNKQGRLYFSNGLKIKKLLQEQPPYYNIAATGKRLDQNAKGYVVGVVGTMFPGSHAFLAIPDPQ